MATYEINGKSYTLDDSLSPAEVAQALNDLTKQISAQSAQSQSAPKPKSDVGALDYARAAGQGLTFGFGDEIVAGLRSLGGETYEQALKDERQRLAAVREESPYLATGLEIAGSLPTALIPGLGLAKLGQMGFKAASSAPAIYGLAGLEGGVYGLGASKDKTVKDFLAGGALGVAGAGVANAAGNAIGKAVSRYKGRENLGKDKLLQAMARDEDTPTKMLQRLEEGQTSGVLPETISDLGGQNVKNLARDIQATPSGARNEAVKTFAERNANQDERILGSLTEALGSQQGGVKYLEDLEKARRQAAKPLYDAAYKTEGGVERFVDSADLERFLKQDEFQDAFARAQRLFKKEQFVRDDLKDVDFPDLFKEVTDKAGKTSVIRTNAAPTVRQLDYIKRGYDDLIKEKSRLGGLGNQERAASLNILSQFRTTIDDIVPEYGAARKRFGDDLDIEEAYQMGGGLMRPNKSADAVRAEFSKLSDPAKQAYRVGVIDEITRSLENSVKTGGRRDAVKRVFDGRQEKLKALFDTPEGYKKFESLMLREANMRNTGDFVTGSSPTARIGASLDDLTRDPIDVFAMGGLRGAAIEGARGLMKNRQRRATERVADELATPMFNSRQTADFLRGLEERARQVGRNQRRRSSFLPAAGGIAEPVSGLLTD